MKSLSSRSKGFEEGLALRRLHVLSPLKRFKRERALFRFIQISEEQFFSGILSEVDTSRGYFSPRSQKLLSTRSVTLFLCVVPDCSLMQPPSILLTRGFTPRVMGRIVHRMLSWLFRVHPSILKSDFSIGGLGCRSNCRRRRRDWILREAHIRGQKSDSNTAREAWHFMLFCANRPWNIKSIRGRLAIR